MYTAKFTSKGQITLPLEVRQALGIRPGENIAFVPAGDGEFRVRRVRSILDLAGCVPYSGPAVSPKGMKDAIAEHLVSHHESSKTPSGRRRPRRQRAS